MDRWTRPFAFTCPAAGEYVLLLAIADEAILADEQSELSESFIRSGGRYAVCNGPASTTWDDSFDMVQVVDEVEGRPSAFVMTT